MKRKCNITIRPHYCAVSDRKFKKRGSGPSALLPSGPSIVSKPNFPNFSMPCLAVQVMSCRAGPCHTFSKKNTALAQPMTHNFAPKLARQCRAFLRCAGPGFFRMGSSCASNKPNPQPSLETSSGSKEIRVVIYKRVTF